ncbi:MAG: hypothetical protein OEZ09_11720 [Betaproteobacteria bacterium]|nr:hypothetical protein [Betaproteobacteria bacterium]
MQTHTILIALGAVLLLAGVMGGGLTLKEMKLPTLDKFSRALAGFVGAVFIGAGIYLERDNRAAVDEPQAGISQQERMRREEEVRAAAEHQKAQALRQAEIERQRREEATRIAELERQRKEEAARIAELERQRKERELEAERLRQQAAAAKAAAERRRQEEDRLAQAKREKDRQEADFTRRALAAPKSNAWLGTFRIYDPKTSRELVRGEVSFGPTTHAENIAYARLRIDDSKLRQLPAGQLEATKAVWGFMGGSTDSAISIVFGNAADMPILVFNKLTKDSANGYLELRGVLFLTQGGKNEVVAHTSASCRAR